MSDQLDATEAPPAPVPAAAFPPPPRLKTLTLRNFRAFPGPTEVPIRFGGKNLVIFGENGAGKSTIFHALDGFFSVAERSKVERQERLRKNVNLFSALDSLWGNLT